MLKLSLFFLAFVFLLSCSNSNNEDKQGKIFLSKVVGTQVGNAYSEPVYLIIQNVGWSQSFIDYKKANAEKLKNSEEAFYKDPLASLEVKYYVLLSQIDWSVFEESTAKKVINDCEILITRDGENSFLYYLLALVYADLKDNENMMLHLNKANELSKYSSYDHERFRMMRDYVRNPPVSIQDEKESFVMIGGIHIETMFVGAVLKRLFADKSLENQKQVFVNKNLNNRCSVILAMILKNHHNGLDPSKAVIDKLKYVTDNQEKALSIEYDEDFMQRYFEQGELEAVYVRLNE